MLFAQFWQPSAIDQTKIVEACGDRAVIILDARFNQKANMQLSESECAKRGYTAYQWHKGDSFTRSTPQGPVIVLPGKE